MLLLLKLLGVCEIIGSQVLVRCIDAVVLGGLILVVILGARLSSLRGHLAARRSRIRHWRRLKVAAVVVVLDKIRSLEIRPQKCDTA